VHHYLDNQAVVDMFNKPTRPAVASTDVWDEIRHWQGLWGANYHVHWQRGHPEKTKPDTQSWSHLDWGNHAADGLAELGRCSPGRDLRDTFQHGQRWRVYVQGARCLDRVGPALLSAIATAHMDTYAAAHGHAAGLSSSTEGAVLRALLPAKRLQDRLWNARFAWTQAVTNRRLNQRRGRRLNTHCPLCDGAGQDTVTHLVRCAAADPARIRTAFLRSLMAGLERRCPAIGHAVQHFAPGANPTGTRPAATACVSEDLTSFLVGHWPASVAQILQRGGTATQAAPSHAAPARALAWAGLRLHNQLWRPLWDLRRQARRPTPSPVLTDVAPSLTTDDVGDLSSSASDDEANLDDG
jgi:hypothetical protein